MPDRAGVAPRTYRLFIAAAIPPEPLAVCRELLSTASSAPPVVAAAGRVRWTRPENLHLTLRFLGDTDPALVTAMETAMQQAAGAVAAFPVTLAGAGTFPASGPPRALWLGTTQGREELTALASALDTELAVRIGLETGTSPFHPHLTVARAGRGEPAAGLAAAAALRSATEGWSATFDVERITLYRSHLGSGQPRYEVLASIALPS